MSVSERLARAEKRIREIGEKEPEKRQVAQPQVISGNRNLAIQCKVFDEFCEQAKDAETLAFTTDEMRSFHVSALREGVIFRYHGALPSSGVLVKAWLSQKVNARKVVEGCL